MLEDMSEVMQEPSVKDVVDETPPIKRKMTVVDVQEDKEVNIED